jgi:ubiquinone/menaquinone biosynthesis C-methylase UbiE
MSRSNGLDQRMRGFIGAVCILAWVGVLPCRAEAPAAAPATAPIYSATQPSADGIGKVYMGREIAQVMGHQAAGWLERAAREREEQPQRVVEDMELRPTDIVGDIGAGSGYFSFRLAAKVPQGKVLAEDIQPEMLELAKKGAAKRAITNVEPVLGTTSDPKLPEAGVDVVLMVDAYHEFDQPREMMEGIFKSLKPGGRVVLVEYRGEDPEVPIKPHHKMTEAQAIKEMAVVGLEHVKTFEDLPRQHVMIFQKKK